MDDYSQMWGVRRIGSDAVKETSLAHYGVQGMHWGEITKEYEPVAVDHRKLKKASTMPASSRTNPYGTGVRAQIRSRIAEKRAAYRRQEALERAQLQRDIQKTRENRDRMAKKLVYGGLAVAGLLAAYGAYKYVRVTKAKAYAGLLNRFVSQNPNASLATTEGRKQLLKGLNLAKSNSSTLKDALHTNRYLRRNGLMTVGRRDALKLYRARRVMNKAASVSLSGAGTRRSVVSRLPSLLRKIKT